MDRDRQYIRYLDDERYGVMDEEDDEEDEDDDA